MKKHLLTLGIGLANLALYAQTARVQIIHNSADANAAFVDIYVEDNGTPLTKLENVAFRTATAFLDLPAATNLKVAVAPSTSTTIADSLKEFNYVLADGETYILVAEGIVSGSGYTPATPFDIYPYAMGRETATVGTNTDVLVHHGATDAPMVDVRERTLGSVVVNDLSFGEYNGTGYLQLPTDDYILDVQTSDNMTTVASFSAPLDGLSLDGAAITVVASGFLDPTMNSGGPAFGLYAATATGGPLVMLPSVAGPTARVQVIHNSADALAEFVDIYVENNGAALTKLENVEFRTATAFLDLPATSNLKVAVAPSTSTTIADSLKEFNYNLAIDETYILVADGIVSGSGYSPVQPFDIYVYAMAREEAAMAGNTDVLVHHGSTDAPIVDVDERTAGNLFDNLMYGEFDGYLPLTTADYILDIKDETGTTTVVSYGAPLATLGLEDSSIVVVASGFLAPGNNSNGPAFGLYVALPEGGALLPLQVDNTLSVEEIVSNGFKIYPNPTIDYINIDNLDIENVTIKIYDNTGRVIDSSLYNIENNRVDVSNLVSGSYQLVLVHDNHPLIPIQFLKN